MTPSLDVFSRLEQLNQIGSALSKVQDINTLLERILIAAMDLTRADGGTLYLVSDDEKRLEFAMMRNQSMHIALGGTTGKPIDVPPLSLFKPDGSHDDSKMAVWAVFHRQTVNIGDYMQPQATSFDFSGPRAFDKRTGYRSRSFLTVPMKDHEDRIIGVLQLINATNQATLETVEFSPADQSLAESLASQAAIALTQRRLISQQEALFEAFINVINTAIDEKSPYTGGHCQRVPELTMMLAEAVSATTSGPLGDFRMTDKDRYELKIAGLLHDCGKITTPVHVVDKATKLQTIFDRIELIETRFEVIKRDAEIKALLTVLDLRQQANRAEETKVMDDFEAERSTLIQDLEFLKHCNVGGESMSISDQERVRHIGQSRVWQNRFQRRLPALTEDEMDNLTIRSGTLTPMERQEINRHIVSTVNMLEALPWPRHLSQVPEYAGGHHERMDGKGYPKGLSGSQLTLQARMMAVADIFEALTASDRPYKQGMTLSRAMNILANFSRNGHIDPDLFEVFVMSGVYRRYGEQFLNSAQLDAVDEVAVLAKGLELARPRPTQIHE